MKGNSLIKNACCTHSNELTVVVETLSEKKIMLASLSHIVGLAYCNTVIVLYYLQDLFAFGES